MYVTVDDLKKHLNIDHDEDDAYISDLEEVAEDAVRTYLQTDLTTYVNGEGNIKPSIRHAIRLLVGTWYANRESVTYAQPHQLPDALTALLLPLKKFM